MSKTLKVSIIGATGYTGLELIRLLQGHPHVELKYLLSRSNVGRPMSSLWPHLEGCLDLTIEDVEYSKVAEDSDVVFFALPHLESQKVMSELLGRTKIIDLSADFRLKDLTLFEKYYKQAHLFPEGVHDFVYGFPEAGYEAIATASNVANPGCFAITSELALIPLAGLIQSVEIFAITGSSGSGKIASEGTHHPVRSHNVKSYKMGVHQHIPEIMQVLGLSEQSIVFVPTSGPFTRGIHLTAFVTTSKDLNEGQVQALFKEAYSDAPFVRLKEAVQLADVVGSNYSDISVKLIGGKIVVQAVIDNLVKGAAGTAIQNMNLMCGFVEKTGLDHFSPLFP